MSEQIIFLSERDISAHGWKMDSFSQAVAEQMHAFYIRDFRTDHTQLILVKNSDFEKIMPVPSIAIGDYVNFIDIAMKKMHKRKLNKIDNSALVPTLVGYVKQTIGYQRWIAMRTPGEPLHLLINVYRNNPGVSVRPMVVRPSTAMLTVQEVKELTEQVKSRDSVSHPEWFR